MQSFSLAQILITAVVSFLLSGVGGLLLARRLARARPTIATTSLGFYGTVVHLSDAAIEASRADDWGRGMAGFVPYSAAIDRDTSTSKLLLELSKVRDIAADWRNANLADSTAKALTTAQLLRCPYFDFVHIGSSSLGQLRRRMHPTLPVSLEGVQALDRRFDLDKHDKGWKVHIGKKAIDFPTHNDFSARELATQELIAESFSRGAVDNIRVIFESFLSNTSEEIRKLSLLQTHLRESISKSAHLAIEVSVGNTGDKPTIFMPHFRLELILGDEQIPILLRSSRDAPEPKASNPLAELLGQEISQKNETGDMFVVEQFLPEASSSPYVSIAGGQTVMLRLISVDELGELGKRLVQHFELGTLRCRVVAYDSNGKPHNSPPVSFGKELSANQKKALVAGGRLPSAV